MTGHDSQGAQLSEWALVQVDDPVGVPRGGEGRAQPVAPQQPGALTRVPATQILQVLPGGVAVDGDDPETPLAGFRNNVAGSLGCNDGDVASQFTGGLGDGEHHDLTAAHRALVRGDGETGHCVSYLQTSTR